MNEGAPGLSHLRTGDTANLDSCDPNQDDPISPGKTHFSSDIAAFFAIQKLSESPGWSIARWKCVRMTFIERQVVSTFALPVTRPEF